MKQVPLLAFAFSIIVFLDPCDQEKTEYGEATKELINLVESDPELKIDADCIN